LDKIRFGRSLLSLPIFIIILFVTLSSYSNYLNATERQNFAKIDEHMARFLHEWYVDRVKNPSRRVFTKSSLSWPVTLVTGRAGLRRFSHSSLPSKRAGGTLADVGEEDEEGGEGRGSVGCLRSPVEKVEKGRGNK